MITSTLRIEGWEYHFSALGSHMCGKPIFYMWFDSLLSGQGHKKKIFEVEGSTYKEAENKMIAVLQNAGILPKPKKKRTLQQNALYRKWLDIIGKDTGNDPEVLHVKMKKLYLSKRKRVVINKKITYENIMGSTTTLNVEEFTDFLNKVYTFFSDMGYVLPTMEQSDIDSLIATYGNR